MPARTPGRRTAPATVINKRTGKTTPYKPGPSKKHPLLLMAQQILDGYNRRPLPRAYDDKTIQQWFTYAGYPRFAQLWSLFIKARNKGYRLAAERLMSRIENMVSILITYRRDRVGVRPARIRPFIGGQKSLSDAFQTLRDLKTYFDNRVEFDYKNGAIYVTTPPITLEDWVHKTGNYPLGRFKIGLTIHSLITTEALNSDAFFTSALEPVPCKTRREYVHPHLHSGSSPKDGRRICPGDGKLAIINALRDGRLADAFDIMERILHNYGDNPYVSLSEWYKVICRDCGYSYSETSEASKCLCGRDVGCSNCVRVCVDCKTKVCSRCVCTADSRILCKSCAVGCVRCGNWVRKKAVTDGDNRCTLCKSLIRCVECQSEVAKKTLKDGKCVVCQRAKCKECGRREPYLGDWDAISNKRGLCNICVLPTCIQCGVHTKPERLRKDLCATCRQFKCSSCNRAYEPEGMRGDPSHPYCPTCYASPCHRVGCANTVPKDTLDTRGYCPTCHAKYIFCADCGTEHAADASVAMAGIQLCEGCAHERAQINDESYGSVWTHETIRRIHQAEAASDPAQLGLWPPLVLQDDSGPVRGLGPEHGRDFVFSDVFQLQPHHETPQPGAAVASESGEELNRLLGCYFDAAEVADAAAVETDAGDD